MLWSVMFLTNHFIFDFFQGFVMNLQPSEAEIGLDIRIPPSAHVEALERRLVEEWAPPSHNLTFEVWLHSGSTDGIYTLYTC